jgi:transmembrane sensor
MSADRKLNEEAIEAVAASWILRRENGPLAPQDRASLEGWLAADSRHRAAYLRLNEAWQFSAGLKSWRRADEPVNPDLLVARGAAVRRFPRWPLAFAAGIGVIVAVGLLSFEMPDTYSTRVGGYERIVLDDGSVVQLNTDSKARVVFSDHRREVKLLRGEAHFDIAKDAARPFDVEAGSTMVRAVGTAFSVRMREAKRVDVLVTQGRVIVEDASGAGAGSGLSASAEAGESVDASPTRVRRKKVENDVLERQLAWQVGRLNFQQEPLAVVVAEFNRYNRRRLELVDPALAALEVHGNFKSTDLDSFVAAIKTTLHVRVEETPSAIRIYSN